MTYINTYVRIYIHYICIGIYICTHYAVGYFSISIMASCGKKYKGYITKMHTHTQLDVLYIGKFPWITDQTHNYYSQESTCTYCLGILGFLSH